MYRPYDDFNLEIAVEGKKLLDMLKGYTVVGKNTSICLIKVRDKLEYRANHRKKKEKGVRRMPRHSTGDEDVASCEKLRVDASSRRSGDVRMGQPQEP